MSIHTHLAPHKSPPPQVGRGVTFSSHVRELGPGLLGCFPQGPHKTYLVLLCPLSCKDSSSLTPHCPPPPAAQTRKVEDRQKGRPYILIEVEPGNELGQTCTIGPASLLKESPAGKGGLLSSWLRTGEGSGLFCSRDPTLLPPCPIWGAHHSASLTRGLGQDPGEQVQPPGQGADRSACPPTLDLPHC